MAKTLFDKIWDAHVVHEEDDGTALLYIDRHLVHEVTSPQAFEGLRQTGRTVRRVDATLAVPDHNVPTTDRAKGIADETSRIQVETLQQNCRDFGITLLDVEDIRQGIVHVIGPEQGFTLPGTTIVCGDSHTSTHGAFGALAFGIGTSEVEHVLATQTLIQRRSKNMRVTVDGTLPLGVTPKDVILAIIGKIGTAGGTGHVIEYAGEVIRAMSMEGRMTVCNMSIEAGARAGLVAPDETTYRYLMGRPMAPKGAAWEQAVAHWRTLPSDPDARFDKEVVLRAADIEPQVTWGTSPQDVQPISGAVPDPASFADERRRAAAERSLFYMALEPGTPINAIAVDRVFIGSCTNCADRGPARRGRDREGPQGGVQRACDGRAGLGPDQAPGRGGRARPDLPRCRLRMARGGLLDVPGDERRQAGAGRALRLDLEPQFRGPAGARRPHPSDVAGDGRRRRDRGPHHRRAQAGVRRLRDPERSVAAVSASIPAVRHRNCGRKIGAS